MTRLAAGIAVALALAGVAAAGGGTDGSPIVGTDGVSGGLHVLRVDKSVAAGMAARFGERTGSRAVESPDHVRIMVFGLAADGISTPEPVATAEPTVRPERTVEPTRDAPVFGASVIDIIRSYDWPDDYAIAVADCESGFDPLAWNPFPVYVNGIEHHATGVMQVLIPLHMWRFDGDSPYDPAANVRVAYQLYLERGFQPWNSGGCP